MAQTIYLGFAPPPFNTLVFVITRSNGTQMTVQQLKTEGVENVATLLDMSVPEFKQKLQAKGLSLNDFNLETLDLNNLADKIKAKKIKHQLMQFAKYVKHNATFQTNAQREAQIQAMKDYLNG